MTNTDFSQRWAGTHLGRPCWSVYRSDWLCLIPLTVGRGRLTWIQVGRHSSRRVSETNDKYWLPPSSRTWQFRTDSSTCCTNTYFVYMFCLFNTLVQPIFSSSVSSFWPLTGHNIYLIFKDRRIYVHFHIYIYIYIYTRRGCLYFS